MSEKSAAELFYEMLYLDLLDGGDRSNSIHVTDLCGDCDRRTLFQKYDPKPPSHVGALLMWMGKQVHKLPLLKGHELSLSFGDGEIVGTADEYDPFTGSLIEKKTTRKIPTSPHKHHIKQIHYYAILLREAGMEVKKAEILYIDTQGRDIPKSYEIPLKSVEWDKVKAEMIDKARQLKEWMKDKYLPPRIMSDPKAPGWWCSYCGFQGECMILRDVWMPIEKLRGERNEGSKD